MRAVILSIAIGVVIALPTAFFVVNQANAGNTISPLGNSSTKPLAFVELAGTKWLNDPIAASKLAKESGKPILTFQMIGKLDEEFC